MECDPRLVQKKLISLCKVVGLTSFVLLCSCGLIYDSYTKFSEAIGLWDFSDASAYTYDSDHIEVTGGQAQLKAVDLNHSGGDFDRGTHVGTYLSTNNNLSLKSQNDTSLDVRQVLPLLSGHLIGYWRMEGDFNDSMGLNNGTAFEAVTSSVSYIGNESGFFDGTNDYVDIGSVSPLTYTKMAWVYINRETGSHNIISGNAANRQAFWVLNSCGTGLSLSAGHSVSGGTYTEVCETTEFPLNSWQHVAVTYNSTTLEMKLYRNGALIDSATGLATHASATGQSYIGAYSTGNVMGGLMDEVSYWDTDLSVASILAVFNAQSGKYPNDTSLSSDWTPKYSNVVGYWKMDGNWQDSSGNGNHGTPMNSPTFSTNVKVGSHSISFDGNVNFAQRVELPSNSELDDLQESSYSLSAWVNPNSLPPNNNTNDKSYGIIRKKGMHIGIFYDDNGTFVINHRQSDNSEIKCISSNNYLPNQFLFIMGVVSYDLNTVNLFVDGKLSCTLPFNGTSREFASEPWRIGSSSDQPSFGHPFNGEIDDAAVWSVSLSEAEVKTIYNRQKQKYAGHYDSPVVDLGAASAWPELNWITTLPFMKELTSTNESSSDYSSLGGDLSDGLVGYWNLNESASTAGGSNDFIDKSGTGNELESAGTLTFGQTGILNKSAHFDGVTSYAEGTNNGLSASSGTIAVWVQPTEIPASNAILYMGNTNPNRIYLMQYSSTSNLGYALGSSGIVDSGVPLPLGAWSYVVMSWNSSGTFFLYKNGVQVTTGGYAGLSAIGPCLSLGSYSNCINTRNSFYPGYLDEPTMWNRALSLSEIQQLYRRGANRIKYQVRSCDDPLCDTEEFIGPDNTGTTYFSELHNNDTIDANGEGIGTVLTASPQLSFSDFTASGLNISNNRYFQYRVFMEAEDNTACSGEPCMPELKSVEIGPSGRYYSGSPSIVNKLPYSFVKPLRSFYEVSQGSCNLSYQLSNDGSSFYYWDGSSWVPGTDVSQSNDYENVVDNISSFSTDVGTGSFYFKSFIGNSNFNSCSLDALSVQ